MSKKVKAKWVVAVPEGAKVMVAVGEEVPANSVLLEINESNEKIINVAGKIRGLSAAEKKKIREMLPGMKVDEDKVVFETGGIFPKRISFPVKGELVKIDEFENLHFKGAENSIRMVYCPVEAKMVKNDGQSLEMEFRAIEYSGKGLNEGKAWGTAGIGYVGEIADLSAKDMGKIVLTEKFNQAWLTKAEVVGVKGVVMIDNQEEEKDDKNNFKLPVIALEKGEWEEVKAMESEVKKALVNASEGRLLLVI